MRIKNYKIKTESHHLTTIALRFCSIIHDNTLTEIITSHISPAIDKSCIKHLTVKLKTVIHF